MRLTLCALVAALAAFILPSAVAQSPQGTVLNVEGQRWTCNRDLSSYAPNGPPLTVNQSWTRAQSSSAGGNGSVRLEPGCTALSWGGRDGKVDLILNIEGDGDTLGSHGDGMNLNGAHDIDIGDPNTSGGHVDCAGGGAHKDGIQVTGGGGPIRNIWFYGFTSGDWLSQTTTCHGAGGIFYLSPLGDNPDLLHNVRCVGCLMVATGAAGSPGGPGGAGMHIGGSTDSGATDSCFAGNFPIRLQSEIRPVNERNFIIQRTNGDPADCPALDSDPPPPPPPPPPTCDEECVAQYEARISTLTEAVVLAQAETAVMAERRLDCRKKLAKINAHFHAEKPRGKMHRPIHWRSGCTGFK